ncbi:uncharacterized protein TM35_001171000, partial [Trypanosoma theileri]
MTWCRVPPSKKRCCWMAHAMNKKNKGKDSPNPHDKGKFRYGDMLKRSPTAMCGVKRKSMGSAKRTFSPIRTHYPIRTLSTHRYFWFIGTPTACPTTTMCEVCLAFPEGMEVRKLCAAIGQPSLPKASRDSLQRSAA